MAEGTLKLNKRVFPHDGLFYVMGMEEADKLMIHEIAAVICMTLFYLAYFYKQVLLAKQGIRTNRLARGQKPVKTMRVEMAVLAATYGMAVIQYGSSGLSRYLVGIPLPKDVRSTGVFLMVIGVAFFIAALATMKDNWRAGVEENQQTVMVIQGVYRISRNPAFVGFDLLYLGSALAMPNVVIFLAAICCILILHLQILQEEKLLPGLFGSAYLDYKKHTPRYLLFF
ncbi:isoprenylcysteine carboxyl methyltransferase [Paenibacillus sp. YN15]|nr:isoprenylcysteine carboxyl methyltransferase [Paenibacillus sp. YN15]